jgi:hypothetical protein
MPRTKAPDASERIKACTSLDELTLTLLEKIRHKFHLSKVDAARMIVGLALEKKIKLAEVTKFYQEVWSNLSFESGQRFSQLRLDWTPEENAFATHLRKTSFQLEQSERGRADIDRLLRRPEQIRRRWPGQEIHDHPYLNAKDY